MQSVDWIVVGNGLAGAALSYELCRQGLSVLLIDEAIPDSATNYSYGGIAYWSGTTELTKHLCQQSIERHRQLSEELAYATEFRELDLLLTIAPDADAQAIAAQYQHFAIAPQLISAQMACELEPQLNPAAIGAALTVKHGHVHPVKTVKAFNYQFRQLGGQQMVAEVTSLVKVGSRVTGITTPTQAYAAGNVAISTGGYTRSILQSIGCSVPLCHTHAELITTPPIEAEFRALTMPAFNQRFGYEDKASSAEAEHLWETPGHELAPPILDPGMIQFVDKSLCIGQVSRFLSSTTPDLNAPLREADIRTAISHLFPALDQVPGTWHHCLVGFSRDGLPLLGPVPNLEGLHVFAGFTSPFALLLPIAEQFAAWVTGQESPVIQQMLVTRFF
jgi:glycine/D-amino acid oxidase-like deaminating enzyme